jgi:hypothetical protein
VTQSSAGTPKLSVAPFIAPEPEEDPFAHVAVAEPEVQVDVAVVEDPFAEDPALDSARRLVQTLEAALEQAREHLRTLER